MNRIIIMPIVILFFFSCKESNKKPDDLLSKDKMTQVLWDFMKADVYTTQFVKKLDSSRNDTLTNAAMQQSIFHHHKIKATIFYNSYRYYCTHPEEMKVILDSIESKQSREKRKLEMDFNRERI